MHVPANGATKGAYTADLEVAIEVQNWGLGEHVSGLATAHIAGVAGASRSSQTTTGRGQPS